MKRTVVALIAVLVCIVLAGSGAWYLDNPGKSHAGNSESITVGMPLLLESSALVIIADDQHFFADNGLNVTIKYYDTGSASVNNMSNGDNDIAVATEFVIVRNAFMRENISAFGTVAKSDKQYYIIGRIDRGIENAADLKGKKIGVPMGTVGEFYLGRFLELHGIELGDVTVVDVPPAQAAETIGNGQVDAVLIWKPFADTIRDKLGPDAVSWSAESGQPGYWNAICMNDWAAEHPELIGRFLESIDQAAKYVIHHPAEAKAIVQKRLNIDDSYVRSAWPDIQYSLSLDQSLITAMEDEGRWMIKNNLTGAKTIPDYRDYLYPEGLAGVNPDSVNII